MEAGKLYGFRARRIYGGAMRTDLYRVNTIAGESSRLYFAAPPVLNDAPATGDLVSFGVYDRETLRVLSVPDEFSLNVPIENSLIGV